jgi:hypothetical protein
VAHTAPLGGDGHPAVATNTHCVAGQGVPGSSTLPVANLQDSLLVLLRPGVALGCSSLALGCKQHSQTRSPYIMDLVHVHAAKASGVDRPIMLMTGCPL